MCRFECFFSVSRFDRLDLTEIPLSLPILTLPRVPLLIWGQRDVIKPSTAAQHTATHHHLCTQAESGFDTAAAEKRVRLAAVPGGARQHACIVQALAEFRRVTARQREEGNGGGGGGGSDGSGGGADGPGGKTSVASTAHALPSGICFQRLSSVLSELA